MKNSKNSKRGITLVGLVVTIIILLILAGISIATLTGSGLFENARLAEQESKNAQELEDATLKDYNNSINKYLSTSRDENDSNTRYSADEQKVGTWTDNKPIYRKVVELSESSLSSYGDVRYIRKDVMQGVDNIINSGGYFILNNRKIQFGASETDWHLKPSFHSYAQVENNSLLIYILYSNPNYGTQSITGEVWLEYTKIND